MGAYLSAPVTEKEYQTGETGRVRFACTSMQGWRTHQEDSHNCIPDFVAGENGCSLFAVYDGHGGAEVAKYISAHFPNFLLSSGLLDALAKTSPSGMEAVSSALKKSFIAFDDHLRQEEVVQKMSAMREEGNAKGAAGKAERDEDEEQEALWEEAIALSEESSVSLETIIRQYAQIKRRMLLKQMGRDLVPEDDEEQGEDGDEESERAWRRRARNANKRALNEPSSNLVKRRKMQRENATTVEDGSEDGEAVEGKNGAESEAKPNVNGPESESAPTPKLNGTKDEVSDGNHLAEKEEGKKEDGAGESAPSDADPSSQSNGAAATAADLPKPETATEHSSEENNKSESAPVEPSAASSNAAGAGEEDGSPRAGPSSAQQLPKLDSGIEEDEEDDEDYDAEKEEDGSEGLTTSTDEDGEEDSDGEEEGEEDEDEEDEEKEEDEVDGEDEEESVDEEDLNGDMGTKAGFDSGATACMALLFPNRIIVANVGDSRAVLCREGKAVDLSIDHKPEDTEERQRIERAGGIVNEEGRVNGGLNLSRALGDHYYKQTEGFLLEEQMITALPDVKVIEGLDTSSGKDQLLVVACDGIWNSMTSQQVVDFVLERRPTKSLKEIGAELTHHCLADGTEGTDGTGCDNMTVIIVDLNKTDGVAEKEPSNGGEKESSAKQGGAGGETVAPKKEEGEANTTAAE